MGFPLTTLKAFASAHIPTHIQKKINAQILVHHTLRNECAYTYEIQLVLLFSYTNTQYTVKDISC